MILLRKLKLNDLDEYKFWKLPQHKYHILNGPYFKKNSKEEVEELIVSLKNDFSEGKAVLDHKRIISNDKDQLIGEVSWYWKSEETNWMEIGIVIFNDEFWNKGIGFMAFKLWIDELFNTKNEIVRLGITTWSGNHGMIKLAEKLGMKKEAVYRKARIINGEYFDSISYGILKEEWFDYTKKDS